MARNSTIPKERGAVGGPEAITVPLTMSIYKTATGVQEDPIDKSNVIVFIRAY